MDTILGFPINRKGMIDRSKWRELSEEKRDEVSTERRKLWADDTVEFRNHSSMKRSDEGKEGGNSSASIMQKKINKLNKELKKSREEGGMDSKPTDKAVTSADNGKTKESTVNKIKSFEGLNDEARSKMVKYYEKHVKTTRIRTYSVTKDQIRRIN